MKVCYITAQVPWGRGETFIIDEMLAVKETGADLTIIPRNPTKEVFHPEARALLDDAVWLPLMSPKMIGAFLLLLLTRPCLWKILGAMLRHSRTWRILVKNLAVVPKGVYIAPLLKKKGVEHIHAHWGSTTATMAWVVSELTGIPWSITLHRWDIAEDNMLKFKVEKAVFARCISEDGRKEVLQIAGEAYQDKIKVLHMGVRIPETLPEMTQHPQVMFVIACPANFVPVKGHRFLVEACALLVKQGFNSFQCLLIGDGPLEESIRRQVAKLGVEEFVKFVGRLPHDELLRMYKEGKVSAVVLPSVVTEDREREGIPVSLMEAMTYGIPVISTATGGIPELLGGGAGILVGEGNTKELTDAIQRLMNDPLLRQELSVKGKWWIKEHFDIMCNINRLLNMMRSVGIPDEKYKRVH